MMSYALLFSARHAAALVSLGLLVGDASAETWTLHDGEDLAVRVQEVADGDVIRLEAGRYAGPLVIDGKRVTIEGPAGGGATIAPGQANVLAAAQNNGEAMLSDLHFETSAEAPIALFAAGAAISCTRCIIHAPGGRPVYAEAGALTFIEGEVTTPDDDAIVALNGSTVTLDGTNITAGGSPLAAENAASVEIAAATLSGGKAVSIYRGAPAISIRDTDVTVAGDGSYGLHLETAGTIAIEGGRVSGGDAGLIARLGPGAAVQVSGLHAVGGRTGLYFQQEAEGEPARVEVTEVVARATGADENAIALRGIGRLELSAVNSTLLSGGKRAVTAETGAKVRVEASTLSAVEFGAVVTTDGPGAAELVDTLVSAQAPVAPGASADAGTTRLASAILNDAALADELKTVLASALAGGDAAQLAPVADRAREAGASMATITFEVADGVGHVRTVPFAVVDLAGEVAAQSADGAPVAVKPDFYLVEQLDDPSIGSDAEVAAGEAAAVRADVADGLWLDLGRIAEGESRPTLFRPMDEENTRKVLRASTPDYAFRSRVARRAAATAEDIANAVDAARRMAGMRISFPKDGTEAEQEAYWSWADAVSQWALPILASAGDRDDLALMTDPERYGDLVHAAYLEQRLGIIADGVVAAVANDPDAEPDHVSLALLVLDFYGVPDARERLIALAEDADWFASLGSSRKWDVSNRLIAFDDPRVLAIAEKTVQRAIDKARTDPAAQEQFMNNATSSFAALVALFGAQEQKRAIVEALPHTYAQGFYWQIAAVARDVMPFVESFVDAEFRGEGSYVETSCAKWRLRGEAEFAGLYEKIVAAYGQAAVARGGDVHPSQIYHTADFTRRVALTPCRPAGEAAQVLYQKMMTSRSVLVGNWLPAFDTADTLKEILTTRPFEKGPLEAAPLEVALQAWSQVDDARWSSFRDDRVAMFRAFTKAGDDQNNALVDDGIERRVYAMRHVIPDEYSGGLAGHVEVRPSAEDGKLVIGVRLKQQPYYNSYGGLADAIATEGGQRRYWANHAYVEDPRKLIERVALHRDGEAVPITEEAVDAEGFFRFATEVPADDLTGLVLDVGLALFEDRRAFQFDIFASSLARNNRAQ